MITSGRRKIWEFWCILRVLIEVTLLLGCFIQIFWIMQGQVYCPAHESQPLDTVCLAPSCTRPKLFCYLCKQEEHSDHQPVLSYKVLLSYYITSKYDQPDFVKSMSEIDKQMLSIRKKLQSSRSKFMNPEMMESSFLGFWQQLAKEVVCFKQVVTQLEEIKEKKGEELVSEMSQWIDRNGGMYEAEEKDAAIKVNFYLDFLKKKWEVLQSMNEFITKILARPEFDDFDILTLFQVEKITRKFNLRFSSELMGTCMTIHAPNKVSMTTTGNQRMMLLEPHLGIGRGVKKWKVRVEKLSSWIGVGVSHLDSVKGVNFDFSYTAANHGNYLLSSNGYSWNGYKMENNTKFGTFQFGTGDTVEVSYDPNANTVSFKKQGGDEVFTYDIDPSHKPIHAAVNLTGIGDSVEIV